MSEQSPPSREPFTSATRSRAMARYYFDLVDGTIQRDQVGAEMIG